MALRPTWKHDKEKRSKKQYVEENADQIRHMRKSMTKNRRVRYDGVEYNAYDEYEWEDE